jgi:hypothetical protein
MQSGRRVTFIATLSAPFRTRKVDMRSTHLKRARIFTARSRDSSVVQQWATDWRAVVRFPARKTDTSLQHPERFKAHPASYPTVLWSMSKSCYGWRSVSMSWCRVHSGTCGQILFSVWKLLCCLCGATSLTRGRICLLSVTVSSI